MWIEAAYTRIGANEPPYTQPKFKLRYPSMSALATNDLVRALRGAYLRRSFGVALVVGTGLNVINQGDAFFGDAPVVWTKLLLTYCVPFCVATYGTYSALRGISSG